MDLDRYRFSGPVTVFQDRRLPEEAIPTGYAALIDAFKLHIPLPRRLSAIGTRHRLYEADGWAIYTPRHATSPDIEGHLTFALKYEGIDLVVLKYLFRTIGPAPFEAVVKSTPTGSYARRIWFLYEWLLGEQLDLPAAEGGSYTQIVDTELQYGSGETTSTRHRVKNNLPGTPAFCPMVFRTEKLRAYVERDFAAKARAIVADISGDILARTAAFLMLKDSKSSFAIEGEHPAHERIQRWSRAIGEAGKRPFDLPELLRLQRIVIGDARFVQLGLRQEGGFVGEHDRDGKPLPEHISARHENLTDLIDGIIAFDRTASRDLDAVIAAAIVAFGFVYIHPFEDGNGRLHRYLIHHTLAERGYNPPGLIFPVSAAILDRINDYRRTLEGYSGQLLPLIKWGATERGNVRILNETVDFYRYFDATPHAEFLYECVERTVDFDLPFETKFLKNYDNFRRQLEDIVDMPDRLSDLLFRFLHQNQGKLSKRARENEFRQMTQTEIERIEDIYDGALGKE